MLLCFSFSMQSSPHSYMYYNATTHRAVVHNSSTMVQGIDVSLRTQGQLEGIQTGSVASIELHNSRPAEKASYSRPLPAIPSEQKDTDEEESSGDEDKEREAKVKGLEPIRGQGAAANEQEIPPRSSSPLNGGEQDIATASSSQVISETFKENDVGSHVDGSGETQDDYGSPVIIEELNYQIQAAQDAEDAEKKKKFHVPPESLTHSSKSSGSFISSVTGVFSGSPKQSTDNNNKHQKSNSSFNDGINKLDGQAKTLSKQITALKNEAKAKDKRIEDQSVLIATQRAEIAQSGGPRRRIKELENTIGTIQAAFKADIEKLKGDRDWWSSKAVEWKQYSGTKDKEFQKLKGEVQELDNEVEKLKESLRVRNLEYMRLQDELNEQKSKTRNTIASANLLQRVAENKEFFIGPQEVDASISNQFSALILKAKTWSRKFQKKYLDFGRTSAITCQQFRKVAPQWSDQDFLTRLNDPESGQRLRPLFVQGWVGLVLAEEVFSCLPSSDHAGSGGRDIWLEDGIFASLKDIELKLYNADRTRVSFSDLNDWRALTNVRLLASQDPKHTKATIQRISQAWALAALNHSGWILDDAINDFTAGLTSIFVEAQKLNQLIRCQRAAWQVRHPSRRVLVPVNVTQEDGTVHQYDPSPEPWCMEFDSRYMKDQSLDYEGGKATVDMVLAPSLWKQGDVDGERFDVESCIVPSLVTLFKQNTNLEME